MILQAPYFLFGLFSLAIPVIIHLVQLRKPQRVLFTNVAFIRQIENITSNQRKLKHWLILLSRILFLTFLVFVFCQPFIPAKDASLGSTDQIKIYFDNSGSMQNVAEKGGISLMELEIDEIQKISKEFPRQSTVQLLDNSFKINNGHNISLENIASALGDIKFSPLYRRTDIIQARLNSGKDNKTERTYWFSDFQRSTFDPVAFNKTDSSSEVNLVLLKPSAQANLFIDSVALEDELVRANENNRLQVKVFNNSDEDKNGVSLKLFIGNRQASANSINLKAKSSATVRLDFRLLDNKIQQARIEIEDQPVIFDNTYYFVLQPASNLNILDLNTSALNNTSRLFTNEPLFHYQGMAPGAINNQSVAGADLIIINELATVEPALADNLAKFVKKGGNLAIIPAEKTIEKGYGSLFENLGIPVRQIGGAEGNVSQLALPDIKDPFFRNIFAELDKRLQMPRSPRMLSWPRSDSDLLTFKNGSSFLSLFNSGKGRIYVFAAPFSIETNEFSRNALFVPVMYKLALSSHQAEQQLAYNFSQRTFSLPVPKTDIRKSVFAFEGDSTKYIPEQQLRGGKMFFTIPSEMADAGFYRLKHNDSTLTTLAFNYPKRESMLDTYSAEELRQLITNKHVKVFESGANADFSQQFTRETQGHSLWQYCLLAALFFLLVEILLLRFL
jgi:hypothetical protein